MAGAAASLERSIVAMSVPKDGSVLTIVSQGLLLLAVGDEQDRAKMRFDMTSLNWIGNLSGSNHVVVTWHNSQVKNLRGCTREGRGDGRVWRGSTSVLEPVLLNELVGTKFKVVLGYPGSSDMTLATEKGEIDGFAGNTWASFKAFQPDWIEKHLLNLIVQIGLKKDLNYPMCRLRPISPPMISIARLCASLPMSRPSDARSRHRPALRPSASQPCGQPSTRLCVIQVSSRKRPRSGSK